MLRSEFQIQSVGSSRLGEIDHGLIARNTKRGDAMRHLFLNYMPLTESDSHAAERMVRHTEFF